MKRELNLNLSGNEVYYTNSLILLVKNMLCSKLHYQKGFNLNPFSYKIVRSRVIPKFQCLPLSLGHRGTSHIRNCFLLGPYSRTMSRALRWSEGGGGDERGTPAGQRTPRKRVRDFPKQHKGPLLAAPANPSTPNLHSPPLTLQPEQPGGRAQVRLHPLFYTHM